MHKKAEYKHIDVLNKIIILFWSTFIIWTSFGLHSTAMAEQNDYGSDVLAEVTTLTDRLNLATLTGFPAIATAVKDMTDALDQLFNAVWKVYNASMLTALNLLESESETTNEEFTEAIQNIIDVTDLAYQFIDKID